MDELVTYDEVARWLRRDVRAAIEVTSPCVTGGPHDWEHRQIDMHRFDGSGGFIDNWQCLGCGTYSSTDPAKIA